MRTIELAAVRHRIRLGEPLPFNVRDADCTLLLAHGQRLQSAAQLGALFERGALVDVDELQHPADRARVAPREALPALWREGLTRVDQALHSAPHASFKAALDDAVDPVLTLVERDPDLAIFQILRHDACADVAYGVQRSVSTAVCAVLVAHRLGWTAAEAARVFKIALTANVSMLGLQGELARQRTPPTPAQQHALQTHPMRSVRLLEAAGVGDADWLHAVLRHHEQEDGGGYPAGCTDVGELASLVRRADLYTSKLAARSHREALAADVAGRQMFMQDPGHPMTAALVKEFGVYPPGCQVRLASGAVGIVVQRGPTVTTPVVACLTAPDGQLLAAPERIDTSLPGQSVIAVIGQRAVNPELTADRLMLLSLR